jgi:hypothetical protein
MKEVTELPSLILGYAEVIQNQASLLTQHPLELLRENGLSEGRQNSQRKGGNHQNLY